MTLCQRLCLSSSARAFAAAESCVERGPLPGALIPPGRAVAASEAGAWGARVVAGSEVPAFAEVMWLALCAEAPLTPPGAVVGLRVRIGFAVGARFTLLQGSLCAVEGRAAFARGKAVFSAAGGRWLGRRFAHVDFIPAKSAC